MSGKPVPYPPYFYCICGSRKSHANCNCTRQGLTVIDVWDDKLCVLRTMYGHVWEEERAGRIMVDKQNLLEEQAVCSPRNKRKKADEEKTRRTTVKYVEELCDRGVVDPAFAFALKHAGELPR